MLLRVHKPVGKKLDVASWHSMEGKTEFHCVVQKKKPERTNTLPQSFNIDTFAGINIIAFGSIYTKIPTWKEPNRMLSTNKDTWNGHQFR